jgi:hypothetical protein
VLIGRFRHPSLRALATLLCVTGVPLAIIGLVRWTFGVPLSAFRPVLSDEVYYWHEALTFARAGLHGGYYTLDEVTNGSGFTPFGSHGAGFVMLYGLAATVFEWHRHSVLILNLVVIALACAIWASMSRLTTARLWVSVLLLVTFWQMLFWASTGMQESLHHAGAIVMAALFARALASTPGTWLAVLGSAMLCLLALVRPTWIIVMPFWALVVTRQWRWSRAGAAVVASLLVGAAMLTIFNRTVAPYARGFSFVEVFNLGVRARSVLENVMFNLGRTIAFGEYDDLEILHRAQYWGVLVVVIGLAVVVWRRRPAAASPASIEAPGPSGPVAHLAIAAAVMSTILVLMLVLYSLTNWAEHRVLSAFLLFGLLLTLAAPGRAPLLLVVALIVSNLAATVTFHRVFAAKRQEQFVWDRRGIFEFERAVAGRIRYQPGQPRWCNTLLTAQEPPYLIAMPGGVGISVVREPEQMPHTPNSRYLLVDESTLAHFMHPPRVETLATLPYGTLYLNLDAECPP